MTPPPEPRAAAWLHRVFVRPMTSGAKRAFVTLLAISFAVGGANLLFTARQVGSTRAAAASIAQLCQAGNEHDAKQIILWERIIAISQPPAHETPAQRARRLATVRAFEAYLHTLFAPRDCNAITH